MFVKVTPRKKGGKTYYYAELVEAYRENKKTKHRRLLYFGSVDQEIAKRLRVAFSKDFNSFTNIEKVKYRAALPYGNFYFLDSLFNQVEIFKYFQSHFTSSDSHITVNTAVMYIKAMLFQRIIQPDSKLAIKEWLPLTPLPHFLGTKALDLQSMYRSLEVLQDNYNIIEKFLFDAAFNYFGQDRKEIYYDLTSSYFEGCRCIIADFGYSRDKRKDRKQIVIGLVTTSDGFPLKCKVYPGNRVDKTTVIEVLSELQEQFTIEDIVFVGDRGMLTADNVATINELKQKYVMALPRSWSKKYIKGRTIDEKTMKMIKKDLYAEFIPVNGQEKLLLCLNTQKREDDYKYREHCIESIKEDLGKLNNNLGKNKNISTRDEAMKRAGIILKQNFARKYFKVETVASQKNSVGFEVSYEIATKKVKSDENLDGTFVIQTNEHEFDDKKLIKTYKNLSKVENAFKVIKNDLDLRPINHYKQNRVEGHVYLCVLAYFFTTIIEYIAAEKKLEKSSRKILKKLSQIGLIEIDLPDGQKKYSITTVDKEQKNILGAYKISRVEVPDVV